MQYSGTQRRPFKFLNIFTHTQTNLYKWKNQESILYLILVVMENPKMLRTTTLEQCNVSNVM